MAQRTSRTRQTLRAACRAPRSCTRGKRVGDRRWPTPRRGDRNPGRCIRKWAYWLLIMSEETNALLALKHAWNGAVAASDAVRDLAPQVLALNDATPVRGLDLEAYHRVALAQSIAVMALRGL